MKIWETKPPATLWAIPGLLRDPFTSYDNEYCYMFRSTRDHQETKTTQYRMKPDQPLLCGKRSITKSQGGGDILKTVKRKKSNWIGHILCRNFLLNTSWKEK